MINSLAMVRNLMQFCNRKLKRLIENFIQTKNKKMRQFEEPRDPILFI